jgi:hypothetical protein
VIDVEDAYTHILVQLTIIQRDVYPLFYTNQTRLIYRLLVDVDHLPLFGEFPPIESPTPFSNKRTT